MHHSTSGSVNNFLKDLSMYAEKAGGETAKIVEKWKAKIEELWGPQQRKKIYSPEHDSIINQWKEQQGRMSQADSSGGMKGMLTAIKKETENFKAAQVKFSMGDPYRSSMGQDIAKWETPNVDSKVLSDLGKPRGTEFQALRDVITENVGEGFQGGLLDLVDSIESVFGQGLAKNFPEYKAMVDKMVNYYKEKFDPHDVAYIVSIWQEQMAGIKAEEMTTPFLGIEGRKDLSFIEKRFKATAEAAKNFQYELNQVEGTDFKGNLAELKAMELPDLGQITIIEQEITRVKILKDHLIGAKYELKAFSAQLKAERGIKEFSDLTRTLNENIASTKALENFTNEFGLAGQQVYDGLNERVRIYRESLINLIALKEQGALDILPGMTEEQKHKVIEATTKIEELKVKMGELRNAFNVGYVFDMLGNSVNNAMVQMVTGVLRGTRDVKSLFKDMLQNIIVSFTADALQQAMNILIGMLKRIVVQATITKYVLSFLGIGLGGGGGSGAAPLAGLYGQGIPGFRQHGGRVQRNKPYVVGEGGKSEMFVPDSSGTVIPQSRLKGGSMMSGGSSGLIVNVHNYGDKEVKVERKQTGSNQQEQLDVFVGQAVARDIRRGGDVSRAIQDTYHFKRAGGGRG